MKLVPRYAKYSKMINILDLRSNYLLEVETNHIFLYLLANRIYKVLLQYDNGALNKIS